MDTIAPSNPNHDGNLITARDAEALPEFVEQLLKLFAEASQVKKAA